MMPKRRTWAVLSILSLLGSAAFADHKSPLFDQLDVNHDSVISRGEWTGNRAAFDRLDRNHDGTLTRKEMEARQNFQEDLDNLMHKR